MKYKNIPDAVIIEDRSWNMTSGYDSKLVPEAEIHNSEKNNNNKIPVLNNPINIYLEKITRINSYTGGAVLSFEIDRQRYFNNFLLEHYFDALKNGRINNGIFTGNFVFGKIPGYSKLSLIEIGTKTHSDLVTKDIYSTKKLITQRLLKPGKVYYNIDGKKIAYFGRFDYKVDRYNHMTKVTDMVGQTDNYFMEFDKYEEIVKSNTSLIHNLTIQKTTNLVEETSEICDYENLRKIYKADANFSGNYYKRYTECVRIN